MSEEGGFRNQTDACINMFKKLLILEVAHESKLDKNIYKYFTLSIQ